ncbi:hypothetical protein QQ045_013215 [Rhodiola kirilowii]
MLAVYCQIRVVNSGISDRKKACERKLGGSNSNIVSILKPHDQFSSTTLIRFGCSPLHTPKLAQRTISISCRIRSFGRLLISQAVVVYFCCVALVAEAHEYHPPSSSKYACEDVNYYYADLDHSKGEALKRKLSSIISNHKSLSYREVWDALKILDAAEVDEPEASAGIVEIYSLKVVPKALAGKPQGWNREHLWPRSYGLTSGPSLTDLHNIRPADVNVNSSRGNKFYGECDSKLHKCLKPANKEAAPDTVTDSKSWTPPMQVRGDIARALMYMAVSYGYHQPGGAPDLQLSDFPNIGNREMGILSTLLRWNRVDPPSREEKLRNERVCKLYQHNRNPFIDHPEYADLIWTENSNFFDK